MAQIPIQFIKTDGLFGVPGRYLHTSTWMYRQHTKYSPLLCLLFEKKQHRIFEPQKGRLKFVNNSNSQQYTLED